MVVAPGLMVMAVIYAVGGVSGADLNPAVALAFALRGDFLPRRVAPHRCTDRAIHATLLLFVMYGNVGPLGATLPHQGSGTSLVTKIVLLSAILVLVISGTAAAGSRLVSHSSAPAVGGTIALLGLIAVAAGPDRQPDSANLASRGDVQEVLPRSDEQLCLVGTERSDEALGLSTLGDVSSRRSCRAHIDRELDLQLRGDPHEGVHSRVDLPELQARDLWLLHAQA